LSKKLAVGMIVLALLTVTAYLPALEGGYIWDDDAYVTENSSLRSTRGLWRTWTDIYANPQYYPLTFTSFWLEYQWWGLKPFGYHLVNVLLHTLSSILFWLVLRRLALPGAWVASAIFALHPVHVESVAWITERKNVLAGVFFLSSALAYLGYTRLGRSPVTAPEEPEDPSRSRGRYLLAIVLFLAALLSKTVTCLLPVALLVILWWKNDALRRRDLLPLAPFFLLGAAGGLLTPWLEVHHVKAVGSAFDYSFVERVLIAGKALWFYPAKLLWPVDLTFIYPRWQIDAGAPECYLYPASAVVLVTALWLARRRIGKGPLAAVLCYAAMIFPALGFFNVYPMRYTFAQDHFQYLASLGIIALAGSALCVYVEKGVVLLEKAPPVGSPPFLSRMARAAVPVVVLAVLWSLTWSQTHVYRNRETLWRYTLLKNPDAWIAHNNLGLVLAGQRRFAEAIVYYERALSLHPDALSYSNIGNALAWQGKLDAAIAAFNRGIMLEPDFVDTYYNLGNALVLQGKYREAEARFREALQRDPSHAKAALNLGDVLAKQGRIRDAVIQFRQAILLDPEYDAALTDLALYLSWEGELEEAEVVYRKALEMNPASENARRGLQGVLMLQKTK
jgi:tetratricopeptide (TPR) repeat protein